MTRVEPWHEREVLVAGAGTSGRSAAEAMLAAGAKVTVTDASAERLAALDSLADAGVALVPGLDVPPERTDLVVTSPGWPPDAPLLTATVRAGIELIGEVELAWRLDQQKPQPAHWLAVTGTNGKTTTVGMLESILRAAGVDAIACGNVGLPVVDAVRAGHEVLAVELSSFQLHWASSLRAKASVVLNLAADHLDWHGGLATYGEAKATIHRGSTLALYNADDEWSRRLADSNTQRVGFTLAAPDTGMLGIEQERVLDRAFDDRGSASGAAEPGETTVLAHVADVHPPGPHNVANALAAAGLARAHGVSADAVVNGLRTFEPSGHRSVTVAEVGDVRYVNDSKATNPHAADFALRTYSRVVWIAGGLLKGADVDELVASNVDRLDGVVLIGADRAKFAEALARHAPNVPVRIVDSGDDTGMLHAVQHATELARPGAVVLLAPAAASMDMFTDYGHRGRLFADAVGTVSRNE